MTSYQHHVSHVLLINTNFIICCMKTDFKLFSVALIEVSCPMMHCSVLFVLMTEEEEDEEEFLESLPTDMMEDEDLQQMSTMARQASFVTRDLSSW